ncbi:retrovirus-related Pol polyprotein from transposon RE1 isoform X2 [Hevea brasiliensis]|uniref:retrovirus-related Pol polyprotein from transposon RE1 isoform X2 n=1 Tax=Hevea brasiliensis TaxID=3981 RepID=UPI0025FE739E|nr:retrovirus-related Pol polyprotein from transposon RE1 isoform X2 [Hevea brasiliensis]
MASVDITIAPSVASALTSHQAWEFLHITYANKSQPRIYSLRDMLAKVTCDTKSIAEYLCEIRSITDELGTAGSPISNAELVVKILSGLGPEYKEISAAIWARDSPISFEELFDKLSDHELFLKHEELKKPLATITANLTQQTPRSQPPSNQSNKKRWGNQQSSHYDSQNSSPRPFSSTQNQSHQIQSFNPRQPFGWRPHFPPHSHGRIQCQLCDKFGHIAKTCRSRPPKNPQAYFAAKLPTSSLTPWVLDTGASHHITTDHQNLNNLYKYASTDEVTMGDGSEHRGILGSRPE